MRRQFLLIHQDFNQDEGLVLILFLILIPILILVLVLPLVLLYEPPHVHDNVFQPGSSWITSTTTPSNRNVLYMRGVPTISHKIDEHEVPQLRSYIAASMETGDARFESLDTP